MFKPPWISILWNAEACEDARFIMGILEGRWLATVDEDPHQPGTVNLLTGHIEAGQPGDVLRFLGAWLVKKKHPLRMQTTGCFFLVDVAID